MATMKAEDNAPNGSSRHSRSSTCYYFFFPIQFWFDTFFARCL